MSAPDLNPSTTNGEPARVDVSQCFSVHSRWNKTVRVLWGVVWLFLYRPTPRFLHGWRRFLLRSFGAKIGRGTFPFPSVKIWAPWNLEVGDHCALSDGVNCYCVDRITIGSHVTISQDSFLCTASHDYEDPHFGLITAPIRIDDGAWVAADAFIGPGVCLGEGVVVAARASVFRDVPSWMVVAGNPAKTIKQRCLRSSIPKLAA